MMRKHILRQSSICLCRFAGVQFLCSSSGECLRKNKESEIRTIKILSTPGGLALAIDGKPEGVTLTEYRSFDLEPGIHNIQITLPNGSFWIREIELPAGRVKCVVVNYRPLPPLPKSPCPFPVNISAPKQVTDGEIITYTADVAYSGTNSSEVQLESYAVECANHQRPGFARR